MPTLNARIREVVGPCSTRTSRGGLWLVAGVGNYKKNQEIIKKLQGVFETWKITTHLNEKEQVTTYWFVITSKSNKHLGICTMEAFGASDGIRNITIEPWYMLQKDLEGNFQRICKESAGKYEKLNVVKS